MEQVEQSGSESPQPSSVQSDTSAAPAEEGNSGTSTRRKRRKREPRPESIIVYRSDTERTDGDERSGDVEVTERSSEEGAKFLATPTGEGNSMFKSPCLLLIWIKDLLSLLIWINDL